MLLLAWSTKLRGFPGQPHVDPFNLALEQVLPFAFQERCIQEPAGSQVRLSTDRQRAAVRRFFVVLPSFLAQLSASPPINLSWLFCLADPTERPEVWSIIAAALPPAACLSLDPVALGHSAHQLEVEDILTSLVELGRYKAITPLQCVTKEQMGTYLQTMCNARIVHMRQLQTMLQGPLELQAQSGQSSCMLLFILCQRTVRLLDSMADATVKQLRFPACAPLLGVVNEAFRSCGAIICSLLDEWWRVRLAIAEGDAARMDVLVRRLAEDTSSSEWSVVPSKSRQILRFGLALLSPSLVCSPKHDELLRVWQLSSAKQQRLGQIFPVFDLSIAFVGLLHPQTVLSADTQPRLRELILQPNGMQTLISMFHSRTSPDVVHVHHTRLWVLSVYRLQHDLASPAQFETWWQSHSDQLQRTAVMVHTALVHLSQQQRITSFATPGPIQKGEQRIYDWMKTELFGDRGILQFWLKFLENIAPDVLVAMPQLQQAWTRVSSGRNLMEITLGIRVACTQPWAVGPLLPPGAGCGCLTTHAIFSHPGSRWQSRDSIVSAILLHLSLSSHTESTGAVESALCDLFSKWLQLVRMLQVRHGAGGDKRALADPSPWLQGTNLAFLNEVLCRLDRCLQSPGPMFTPRLTRLCSIISSVQQVVLVSLTPGLVGTDLITPSLSQLLADHSMIGPGSAFAHDPQLAIVVRLVLADAPAGCWKHLQAADGLMRGVADRRRAMSVRWPLPTFLARPHFSDPALLGKLLQHLRSPMMQAERSACGLLISCASLGYQLDAIAVESTLKHLGDRLPRKLRWSLVRALCHMVPDAGVASRSGADSMLKLLVHRLLAEMGSNWLSEQSDPLLLVLLQLARRGAMTQEEMETVLAKIVIPHLLLQTAPASVPINTEAAVDSPAAAAASVPPASVSAQIKSMLNDQTMEFVSSTSAFDDPLLGGVVRALELAEVFSARRPALCADPAVLEPHPRVLEWCGLPVFWRPFGRVDHLLGEFNQEWNAQANTAQLERTVSPACALLRLVRPTASGLSIAARVCKAVLDGIVASERSERKSPSVLLPDTVNERGLAANLWILQSLEQVRQAWMMHQPADDILQASGTRAAAASAASSAASSSAAGLSLSSRLSPEVCTLLECHSFVLTSVAYDTLSSEVRVPQSLQLCLRQWIGEWVGHCTTPKIALSLAAQLHAKLKTSPRRDLSLKPVHVEQWMELCAQQLTNKAVMAPARLSPEPRTARALISVESTPVAPACAATAAAAGASTRSSSSSPPRSAGLPSLLPSVLSLLQYGCRTLTGQSTMVSDGELKAAAKLCSFVMAIELADSQQEAANNAAVEPQEGPRGVHRTIIEWVLRWIGARVAQVRASGKRCAHWSLADLLPMLLEPGLAHLRVSVSPLLKEIFLDLDDAGLAPRCGWRVSIAAAFPGLLPEPLSSAVQGMTKTGTVKSQGKAAAAAANSAAVHPTVEHAQLLHQFQQALGGFSLASPSSAAGAGLASMSMSSLPGAMAAGPFLSFSPASLSQFAANADAHALHEPAATSKERKRRSPKAQDSRVQSEAATASSRRSDLPAAAAASASSSSRKRILDHAGAQSASGVLHAASFGLSVDGGAPVGIPGCGKKARSGPAPQAPSQAASFAAVTLGADGPLAAASATSASMAVGTDDHTAAGEFNGTAGPKPMQEE